jgi:ectoine hydroxylase-related dioxygenase (phytanoyl-CoA dioxygenase family)
MQCQLTIDGQSHQYQIEGDFFWGEDQVLFEKDADTLALVAWREQGYTVQPLFDAAAFSTIRESLTQRLKTILQAEVPTLDLAHFQLENYHHYVQDEVHQRVISQTRFLDFSSFEIDTQQLCEKVSAILGRAVGCHNQLLERDVVILRISRPNSLDINPPHRDGYLEIWQRTINLWIPIAGCSDQSSLPVIAGSHFWNENTIYRTAAKGAKIQGNNYHVPAILQTKQGPLSLARQNPQPGEALIFTPYLVHGSAINQQADTTRMSLEIRLPFHS